MDKNLFSGLEDLGFEDINKIDIYKKEEKNEVNSKATSAENQLSEEEKQRSLLYDKEVTCPVCQNVFKARAVKTSAYRVKKKDSDFHIVYDVINPYFYDVWLCNVCGYAAMKSDFEKIRNFEVEAVQKKITPKWRGRRYPEVFDLDVAIERYKLSLLNYVLMETKASKKAMNCMKIAWMYRLKDDEVNEQIFLKQALEGFNEAYFNENFPIYGMDNHTVMYLLGELNRRINNTDEAMKWFSQVITTHGVAPKLKELARDQKDLITENSNANENSSSDTEDFTVDETNKKKGFLSKLFK